MCVYVTLMLRRIRDLFSYYVGKVAGVIASVVGNGKGILKSIFTVFPR